MSNNKQSSIDWLANKMYENKGVITIAELKQAKAMHEFEIQNAFINGYFNANIFVHTDLSADENYYEQKFGKHNGE